MNIVFNKDKRKHKVALDKYNDEGFRFWRKYQDGNSLQSNYTPLTLVLEMLNKLDTLDGKDIAVIANVEIFSFLKALKKYEHINYNSITFITDIKSLKGKDNIEVVDFTEIPYINLNMKFDVVIGNPPFSKKAGTSTYSTPIQNYFVKFALAHAEQVLLVTQANYCGPIKSTLKKDLADNNTVYLSHTEAFRKQVPNMEICWFYIDNTVKPTQTLIRNREGIDLNITIENGEIIPVSVPSVNLNILKKIKINTVNTLGSLFSMNYDVLNCNIDSTISGGDKVLQTVGGVDKDLSIVETTITVKHKSKLFNNWKVLTPWVADKNKLGAIKVAGPGIILSKSIVGLVQRTEEEANNCKSYLESKLIQFLVNNIKTAPNNSKAMWDKIPLLDFSKQYTDEELYKIFKITPEEAQVIEAGTVK